MKNILSRLQLPKKYAGMGAAFGDQIIYSASSFLTGILVGRLLSIGDFGEFSLGLTLLIFSIIFQDTLLATPYTVQFHKEDPRRHPELRGGAIIQSFLLSGFCSLLMLFIATFVPLAALDSLRSILYALAVCLPFIFFRECIRRQLFAEFRMTEALKLDAGVSILQFSLIYAFYACGHLTPVTAFLSIGTACLIGGGAMWLYNPSHYAFNHANIIEDTRNNLLFGRWLLGGSFFHLGSLYAYSWFLFFSHGKVEAGAYAACFNIISLLNPLILGFNNHFRPKIAQVFAKDGVGAMDALINHSFKFIAPLSVCAVIGTVVLGDWIVRLFYGSEFSGLGMVISILSISIIPTLMNAPLQLGVLAMHKPQINPMFHACAFATTALIGLPMVQSFGKMGAASGYALTTVVGCTVLYLLYRKEIRVPR